MRFNIMNLFPDMNVSGAGGNNPNQVKSSGEKEEKKKPVTVNIFSTYDTDKNQQVNYTEAKSNSIFGEMADFNSMEPKNVTVPSARTRIISDTNLDSSALSAIRNKAIEKYNPINKFNEMLETFSYKTGVKQVTFESGIEDSHRITNERTEMDFMARQEASFFTLDTNEEVMRMYQEKLNEAMQEYDQENAKEVSVYSSYDSDENKTVTGSEAKQNNLLHVDSYSLGKMRPTTMSGNEGTLRIVHQKASASLGFNPAQEFENKIAEFNETYESQTTQTGALKESQSYRDIQRTIDGQIKQKAESFNNKINSEIQTKYQAALEDAYAQLTPEEFAQANSDDNAIELARINANKEIKLARINADKEIDVAHINANTNKQNKSCLIGSLSVSRDLLSGLGNSNPSTNNDHEDNNTYSYTIKKDISVSKLAKKLKTSVETILSLNENLKKDTILKKDQKVILPKK